MGKPSKQGYHEPPKITGAEILKKAQLRSKLRYQGFLRPPTIEDPQTKFLSTAFPALQALETGRPPQPPPAFDTRGGALPQLVGMEGGVGPGPFPPMGGGGITPEDMNMGRTSINDFEDMGVMPSGSVQAAATKRKADEDPDESGPTKKSNTRVSFDPQHPFWTTHNIDPSTVRQIPTSRPRAAPTKSKGVENQEGAEATKKSNMRVIK
jgi:hypothetical protein